MRLLLCFSLGFLLLLPRMAFCGAPSDVGARQITREEARALLNKALEGSKMTKLPEFKLTESTSDGNSRWYLFRGTWAGAPNGSYIIGYWAVDKRTAEVWKGVICQELKFPALEDMQSDIRQKIGLSVEEYLKIRVDGPECGPHTGKLNLIK
jgi:hypothetical protein